MMSWGVLTCPSVAQQALYSHGNPTALEQQMLELINRARMNPTREGVLLDSVSTWYSQDARARKPAFFANLRAEFASYPAVPPLAFHPKLLQAARAHSADMVARNFFAHVNPNGQDPTARAAAVGYDAGVGENLSGGGATSGFDVALNHFALMVDYDNVDLAHPLGHRYNILSSAYSEAGMGIAGSYQAGKITQDFGAPARSYILGVVYTDADGNGSYDPGEGLAGISVTPSIGSHYAVSSSSGGFAIPIEPVETVSDTVSLPFAVNGSSWTTVQPYDTAYRQQQMQAAPPLQVTLTWSGGSLASASTSVVTIKRPVMRNYRLTGTDGWFYDMTMVTTQNVKADLVPSRASLAAPTPKPLRDFNDDGKTDLIFQNAAGQIYAWFLDGTGSALNFTTGTGLAPGSKLISSAALGDWKLVAKNDVNSDGFPDLIFQNSAGQIYAWFLDGTGNAVNFTTGSGLKPGSKLLYAVGTGDWRVVGANDVNNDGFPDLILQNRIGQILAWFLDGTGDEMNFSTGRGLRPGSKMLYSAGMGDWKVVAVNDVNNDGFSDLIFQNGAGQIYAWFLDGTGNALNFTTGSGLKPGSKLLSSAGLGSWRVVGVNDFNGDGFADLLFQNTIGHIYVWFLDGTGNALSFSTGLGLKPGSKMLYSSGLGGWRVR